MTPANEAAVIVLACRDLDGLLKRKYTFFGGAFVTVMFLIVIAIITLFVNETWFIFSLSIPLLLWLLSEMYLERINQQIQQVLDIIQSHHQHELLRKEV